MKYSILAFKRICLNVGTFQFWFVTLFSMRLKVYYNITALLLFIVNIFCFGLFFHFSSIHMFAGVVLTVHRTAAPVHYVWKVVSLVSILMYRWSTALYRSNVWIHK